MAQAAADGARVEDNGKDGDERKDRDDGHLMLFGLGIGEEGAGDGVVGVLSEGDGAFCGETGDGKATGLRGFPTGGDEPGEGFDAEGGGADREVTGGKVSEGEQAEGDAAEGERAD